MEPLLVSALVFSLSQVVLSTLLLLRRGKSWSIQEKCLAVFLLAAIGYLTFPLIQNYWLQTFVMLIQTLLPSAFWLFCASLFDDQFELRSWKILLVATTVLLPLASAVLLAFDIETPTILFRTFPQALEFIILGLALFAITRYWREDLVEARRDLRLWFCTINGIFIFTLILLREVVFPNAEWLNVWQYVPVGVICLITNMLLLQYRPGLIDFPAQHSHINKQKPFFEKTPASELEVPADVVQQINTLMTHDHVYREMGFTIGQLADKLDLPEYRLRKIINAGLGYRNFNDFLNGYRIEEAGKHLRDPDKAGEAVLNIALDTGFRSLSPFNKAFRAYYGQTPTEYRNAHLGTKASKADTFLN